MKKLIVLALFIFCMSIPQKMDASTSFLPAANYKLLDPIPEENFLRNINNTYPTTAVKIGSSLTGKDYTSFKISFNAKGTQFLEDFKANKEMFTYLYSYDFELIRKLKDITKIIDRMILLNHFEHTQEYYLTDSALIIDLYGMNIALQKNELNSDYLDLNLFIGNVYDYPNHLDPFVVHIPNPDLKTEDIYIQEIERDIVDPELITPYDVVTINTKDTLNLYELEKEFKVKDNGKFIKVPVYFSNSNYVEGELGEYYADYFAFDYSGNKGTYRIRIIVERTHAEEMIFQIKTFWHKTKELFTKIWDFCAKHVNKFISILKKL